MCAVSAIADDWRKIHMPNIWPVVDPFANPPKIQSWATKEELESIKKDLEALKLKLIEGKAQDEAEGNPDCEMDEKIAILKQLGKLFNVDLEKVFKNEA